jgi:hypothetical protein
MTSEKLYFKFNRDKTIEVILYIATQLPKPSYHPILKVLYEADKLSLVRYGRFISGGEYYAMEHGPVSSETYDLMKHPDQRPDDAFAVGKKGTIRPLREPNLDWLSESDRECLDEALTIVSPLEDFSERSAASHDKAYVIAWTERGQKRRARMSVENIASTLDETGQLLDFLMTRYDD